MALSRLGNTRRSENFTWPGFVDALASLLMVIIFVLMVFVLIQANLVYRVSGQDATLGEMRQQLASLSELLNIERRASADLAADLAQLQIQLDSSETERGALTKQLALVQAALGTRTSELTALTTKQAETEAALNAARDALDERLRALQMVEGQLSLSEARNRTHQQKMQNFDFKSLFTIVIFKMFKKLRKMKTSMFYNGYWTNAKPTLKNLECKKNTADTKQRILLKYCNF